jgi:hypothetical protein
LLSEHLKPIGFHTWDQESWDVYRDRISLPAEEGTLQFFRQVVYDHFEHFNEHFPDFVLQDYTIDVEVFLASQIRDQVRYLQNASVDLWASQFDHFHAINHDYMIYRHMVEKLTPPFPPVVIDSSRLVDEGWRVYGRPFHLIEGTHRVSYLMRMLERGMIAENSAHKLVTLRPYAAHE